MPVVERFVAAIRSRVHVDHHEIAFVDILGGEKETMIVGPQGALYFLEIASNTGETTLPIRS